MTYYAALDVSLRSVHVCVIDDQGEIQAETRLDSEVADIIAYLDSLDLELASVGLEAGTVTEALSTSLFEIKNEWIAVAVAPLNSIAGLFGMLLLCMHHFYRKTVR